MVHFLVPFSPHQLNKLILQGLFSPCLWASLPCPLSILFTLGWLPRVVGSWTHDCRAWVDYREVWTDSQHSGSLDMLDGCRVGESWRIECRTEQKPGRSDTVCLGHLSCFSSLLSPSILQICPLVFLEVCEQRTNNCLKQGLIYGHTTLNMSHLIWSMGLWVSINWIAYWSIHPCSQ
jgi:hypothetical protein